MVETLYNETYNYLGEIVKREIVERTTDENGEITMLILSVEEFN
jgi:hypothetical protein